MWQSTHYNNHNGSSLAGATEEEDTATLPVNFNSEQGKYCTCQRQCLEQAGVQELVVVLTPI